MCNSETQPLLASKQRNPKYLNRNYGKNREATTSTAVESKKEHWKSWIIVAAAFYSLFILNGAEYAFGSLMEQLMKQTGLARSTISIAGSTQVALSAFTAPLASLMINKMGTLKVSTIGSIMAMVGFLGSSFATEIIGVFTGLSVLAGSGFGLMYMPAMVAVAENFDQQRTLALALTLCGPAAGQVVLSPLMTWLTDTYGWRGCLRALSVLCASSILTGRVLKQPSRDPSSEVEEEDNFQIVDHERPILAWILGDKLSRHQYVWVFVLLILADSFAVMALFIPYSYIQPVAAIVNIPPHLTSILIAIIGLGSIMGRLTSSFLTKNPKVKSLFLIRASIALVSILPIVFTLIDQFWMFALACFMFGFLTGQWIAATSPFLVQLLGVFNINKALGLLTFVQGAASLISPPLAGISVEMSSNPLMALYVSAFLLMISATVYTTAILVMDKKRCRIITYDRFYSEI